MNIKTLKSGIGTTHAAYIKNTVVIGIRKRNTTYAAITINDIKSKCIQLYDNFLLEITKQLHKPHEYIIKLNARYFTLECRLY